MATGLIPPEMVSVLQNEVLGSFDTTLDWYQASAQPDLHGEFAYSATPVALPARVVLEQTQLWDSQGQQLIAVQTIYVAAGTPVGVNDKLLAQGALPGRWPLILELQPMPDTGTPIVLRIRTGQA